MTTSPSSSDLLTNRAEAWRGPVWQSLAVIAISMFWQQRWGTLPDTSWLITVCERMLGGERLYVDVIETSPPFSVWLYMPAIVASRFLGIAPEIGVHLQSCVAALLGIGLAAAIIHRAAPPERGALLRLLPLFVALFLLFPGNAFTQRDYFGTVLFLPLLAMMAWRAAGGRPGRRDLFLIFAAGLCGSALVMVKPYYVIVYVVPALYVAWRRRSALLLLAPENCLVGFVATVYGAVVLWKYPEYVAQVLPLLHDIYMPSADPTGVAKYYGPLYLMLLLLIWLAAPKARLSPLCTVAVLASIAATVPLVYQGKGWPYHAFPAISLGLVALICRFAASPLQVKEPRMLIRIAIAAVFVALAWRPFAATQKLDGEFVDTVRAAESAMPAPTLAMIGSDVAAAHPLTRLVGANYLSAYGSDWLGALSFGLAERARSLGQTEDAVRYQSISNSYIDAKYADFTAHDFDLIVVQQDEPAWVSYIVDQPRFAALLAEYHAVAKDERFTVYARNASPKVGS